MIIQYDADRQNPNPPGNVGATFHQDTANAGKSEATLVWDPATDEPASFYNSGIQGYRVEYKEAGGVYQIFDYNDDGIGNSSDVIAHSAGIAQYSVDIPNLNPRTYYTFKVFTWDAGTGTSEVSTTTSDVFSGDYNPPTAPDEVIIAPENWTTDISPLIAWNGVGSEEGESITYEYAINDPNGTWNALGSYYDSDAANVIANPDFETGTANWSALNSTNSADSNILTNTCDGSADIGTIYQDTSCTASIGDKVFVSCRARVTNSDCDELSLGLDGTTAGTLAIADSIEEPIENQWYTLSGIVTVPADFSGNYSLSINQEYEDSTTAFGQEIEIDGTDGYKIFMVDLTSSQGAGNEPELNECQALYGSQAYKELDLSTQISTDGQYNIYIRANDGVNSGDYESGTYYYDATTPIAHIDSPADTSVVDSSFSIMGDVSDAASFAGWELRYTEGDTELPSNFPSENTLANDFSANPTSITDGLLYQWNMGSSELEDGPYSLWLRSSDKAGNTSDHFITINKSAVSQSTNPELVFTTPDPIEDPPEATTIPYTVSYQRDGGNAEGLTNIELYVNGELVDTASDYTEDVSVDFSDPQYVEGESYYLYVKATDGIEEKYTAEFYETPFYDYFNDTSKIALPINSNIEHSTDKITLKADDITGDYPTDPNGYAFTSSFDNTISGYVRNVTLKAEHVLPTDTDIFYEVSNNGVDFQQLDIAGVDMVNDGKHVEFSTIGNQIILRATLKTSNSSVTPELLWWTADIEQVAQGQEVKTKLLHEPVNVSAMPNVNYKVLIRWDEDDINPNPSGTTYNVYRYKVIGGTAPSVPGGPSSVEGASNLEQAQSYTQVDGTLIAEGLTEKFFYDYNLDYSQLYSYKVSAVYDFGTTENPNIRESILSDYQIESIVSSNEFDKRLGLQDYWKYTGFVTGSGTGQIELSKGNLCYKSTDFVLPGPMFAMVMNRTYNSQATSKTPLGYSNDFSFNTSLMREYNYYGNETGVILKDGDGSIHRFTKNGDLYESPNGVFMELTHQVPTVVNPELDERWIVERKDGIKYIYDEYMMLMRFEDRNGNYLEYSYDERGNFTSITDNANNTISFEYNSEDLLERIIVPAIENNEYRVYTYSYYENDRLKKRELKLEDNLGNPITVDEYVEEFVYDEYIDASSNSFWLMGEIYDGEGYSPTPGAGYATVITYDGEVDGYGSAPGKGVVTNVEYPD